MIPIEDPPPILAAVIGINKYSSEAYNNLTGARTDADRIEEFLTLRMQVPRENIRSLRDEQASRKAIIDSFLFLRNNEKYKKDEAAIVIYFAGHGASTSKPKEWVNWDAPNGKISMLCPSDINEDTQPIVPGIPDRTLSGLLKQISYYKGNNITVILDCCKAAGMTRDRTIYNSDNFVVQSTENRPRAQFECDQQFWTTGSLGSAAAEGSSRSFDGTHILLAGCGRDQLACETPETKQGFFTTSLLKIFASDKFERLTYASLMDRLLMPKRQTPHCEGEGKHRRLFSIQDGAADASLFAAKCKKDGTITLSAGTMHGIRPGCVFSVHKTNLVATASHLNPCIGKVKAADVNPIISIVKLPSSKWSDRMPRIVYCKPLSGPESPGISIFSRNIQWLEHIFPPLDCTKFSILLVNNVANCDLELTLEGDSVYFDLHSTLVTPHIGTRIRDTVKADDICGIRRVVKASMHFYYHITRTSPYDFEDVRMEMHGAALDGFDDDTFPKAEGIPDHATYVVPEKGPMSMTIFNDGDLPLYPYLFSFAPAELNIVSLFSPPIGAGFGRHTAHHIAKLSNCSSGHTIGAKKLSARRDSYALPDMDMSPQMTVDISTTPIGLDSPLPPRSRLAIGYGAGGSEPWEFRVPEGKDKSIGFVRLFLSNRPVSFGNIVQASPFEKTRGGTIGLTERDSVELDRWAVKTATIIQV